MDVHKKAKETRRLRGFFSLFMLALGEDALVEQIKKCFETDTPMPSALHDAAMLLYRQYLVVGGMPECVLQFTQTKDYISQIDQEKGILVELRSDSGLAYGCCQMAQSDSLGEAHS